MRMLIACLACFSLASLIAVAGDAGKTGAKVEGTWLATSGVSKGEKIPEDVVAKLMVTVVFKDGKYTVTVLGKEVEAGGYKVDASKKPATIDLAITSGNDKGKTQLGIYTIDGDKLKMAIAYADSKDRPKSFEPGKDVEITELKRSK